MFAVVGEFTNDMAGGSGLTLGEIACADYDGGNRVAVYNTSRKNIHVRDDIIFFTERTESV